MFDTPKIKSSAVAALIAVEALFSFSSAALAQSATGGNSTARVGAGNSPPNRLDNERGRGISAPARAAL